MYRAYGTELAKLHSIPYDALPKRKTFEINYVKLGSSVSKFFIEIIEINLNKFSTKCIY